MAVERGNFLFFTARGRLGRSFCALIQMYRCAKKPSYWGQERNFTRRRGARRRQKLAADERGRRRFQAGTDGSKVDEQERTEETEELLIGGVATRWWDRSKHTAVAIVTGNMEGHQLRPGAYRTNFNRFTAVLVKAQGDWKIAAIENTNMAEPPAKK